MRQRLIATEEDAGNRLDRFLALKISDHSRTYLARLIESGGVELNGKMETRCRHIVRAGDRIDIDFPPPEPTGIQPEDVPLDIVFEDESFVVLVKPAGMTVHPGAGQKTGTLVNALVYRFSRLSWRNHERPGIVHRLDRNTSGLLVVAKSERVHHKLAAQFQRREVEKHYLALVFGSGLDLHGKIDAPIGRHPLHRTRMAVTRSGRHALTLYDVLETFRDFTYLKITLKTGRTHQIRVHLAHVSHPIAGDSVYGKGRLENVRSKEIQTRLTTLNRLFLHATFLQFRHPKTAEILQFSSPLPQDLTSLLEFLKAEDRMLK
ncbi:MAG: RluA family pseudouridine synthase [Acidobacteria bacterium]|nr:RluA family pseudouridine synthase [Acidobacteriota bacterium]